MSGEGTSADRVNGHRQRFLAWKNARSIIVALLKEASRFNREQQGSLGLLLVKEVLRLDVEEQSASTVGLTACFACFRLSQFSFVLASASLFLANVSFRSACFRASASLPAAFVALSRALLSRRV